MDFVTIHLSWSPFPQRRSPHSLDGPSVVLGRLHVIITTVLITNSELYNSLQAIITGLNCHFINITCMIQRILLSKKILYQMICFKF